MGRKLIDTKTAFRPVYSMYAHEYLGVIISAHIVKELENGDLSLEHQGLLPDNFSWFDHRLDEDDKRLVKILHEVSPKEVLRKYEPDQKKWNSFFLKKFNGQIKEMVQEYMARRLAQALPMLLSKDLYVMGNDGYPAYRPVEVVEDRASILFHFRKNEDNTHYFPTIKLEGEKIEFVGKGGIVVCEKPAWVLLDNRLFSFQGNLDGKKLKPFLKKKFVAIPRSHEPQYYEKFIAPLIEQHDVFAKGFEIVPVNEKPEFFLEVNSMGSDSISFVLKARYGAYTLKVPGNHNCSVEMRKDGEEYTFYRIRRNLHAEIAAEEFLGSLKGDGGLLKWTLMEKQAGLGWLAENVDKLEEWGIKIKQNIEGVNLNFTQPEIFMESKEAGDWFDIQAMVRIGEFEIPFAKFRKNILKGIREYVLPDNSVAILPDSWFSDFRHLVEIAEERKDGTLSIRKYQAGLLEMKTPIAGMAGFLDKLSNLSNGKVEETEVPKGLKATLRKYQLEGYNWLNFLSGNNLGGILADDMGLGKTLQTISLVQRIKETKEKATSLVVMPTSLIYNWMEEAKKFAKDLKVLNHSGMNRDKDPAKFDKYDLVLTTYGTVRQDIEFLKTFPFHYVILDESQMIKNPASKTNKAVRELVSNHRLSLTGTPLENTLMDVWSQMNFLNPGFLGSETFFRDFYVNPIEKNRDEDRMKKLRALLNPFILRRTKEQVAEDLPPKVEQTYFCEMDEAQKELYDSVKSSYRNYLMDLFNSGEAKKNKLHILAGLQKLRQIAIHPGLVDEGKHITESAKFEEFKRMLMDVVSEGSKVLVFSQFVKFLEIIKEDLEEEGIDYSYLTGQTRDRRAEVEKFQEKENTKVFLISLKAGGVGLNLTAAEYVFILDPWWNPAVEAQAVDRAHRIGQDKTIFSYKFITRGTIEEKILKLQAKKSKLSKDIVTVEDEMFKTLNKDELLDLVK